MLALIIHLAKAKRNTFVEYGQSLRLDICLLLACCRLPLLCRAVRSNLLLAAYLIA